MGKILKLKKQKEKKNIYFVLQVYIHQKTHTHTHTHTLVWSTVYNIISSDDVTLDNDNEGKSYEVENLSDNGIRVKRIKYYQFQNLKISF